MPVSKYIHENISVTCNDVLAVETCFILISTKESNMSLLDIFQYNPTQVLQIRMRNSCND